MPISAHFLGTGAPGLAPTIVVSISERVTRDYIFNIPDGAQRAVAASKLRIKNISTAFFTSTHPESCGGVTGFSLTRNGTGSAAPLQLMEMPGQDLRPIGRRRQVEYPEQKMGMMAQKLRDGVYTDDNLTVRTVLSYVGLPQAFRLTFPDAKGKFDGGKAARLGIPNGPVRGRLMRGETITLDSGVVISPADIVSDPVVIGEVFLLVPPDRDAEKVITKLLVDPLLAPMSFRRIEDKSAPPNVVILSEALLAAGCTRTWIAMIRVRCPRTMFVVLARRGVSFAPTVLFAQALAGIAPTPGMWDGTMGDFSFTGGELYAPGAPEPSCVELYRKTLGAQLITATPGTIVNFFPFRPARFLEQPSAALAWADVCTYAREKLACETELSIPTPVADPALPHVLVGGSGAMCPSKYRNVVSNLLRISPDVSLLVDCGEGTLGQLVMRFGAHALGDILLSIRAVMITHQHADHYIGLWALSHARAACWLERFECAPPPLPVVYAANPMLDNFMSGVIGSCPPPGGLRKVYTSSFDVLPSGTKEPFELHKLDAAFPEQACVLAFHTKHAYDSRGFAVFDGIGGLFVFSGDCRPSPFLVLAAAEIRRRVPVTFALLVHEATLEKGMTAEAFDRDHCTADQAMLVALAMGADVLVTTHFSQRFSKTGPEISRTLTREDLPTFFTDALHKYGMIFDTDGRRPIAVPALDLMAIGEENALALSKAAETFRLLIPE